MRLGKRIIALVMTFILLFTIQGYLIQDTAYASEVNANSEKKSVLSDKVNTLANDVTGCEKKDPNAEKVKEGVVEKLFWDTFGHGTTTTSTTIANKSKDRLVKQLGNSYTKDLKNALKYDKISNNLGKRSGAVNKITKQRQVNLFKDKTNGALKQAANNRWVRKGAQIAGKTLDVISIGEDVYHYNDRVHKHVSLDFLARTARGCSIISSSLATVSKNPLYQTASLAFGLTKDVLLSKTLVDAADNYDSTLFLAADIAMASLNGMMINLFGGDGGEYWRSFGFVDRYSRLQGGKKTPAGAPCYKPNIYIYPNEPTNVEVEFDYPALLTTTIPDYSGKWEANVKPNGQITDAKGNKYGYLFYESQTDIELFQQNEGWYVKADSREKTYTQILTKYGFNKQEIKDFNEYWTDKLELGKDYIMYPQLTDAVDAAMPIQITPTPEKIFRLWFVFSEVTDENKNVIQPDIEKFDRTGYDVVEWGGIYE